MFLPLILGIVVASLSFSSGLITMCIFYKKNNPKSEKSNKRVAAPVSARLPSLISIEIILLLWYLMFCTPLILLFLFYPILGTTNTLGSLIFIFSFIPLITTHIVRIWLLKLKYQVTSLSMLNQLGVAKWKQLRAGIWTKLYYNHKWCHNIKILMIVSVIFDILITALYSVLCFIDITYRFYLNITVFPSLTLCVIIGIFSIKALQDPFHIFREEALILSAWFIAGVILFILLVLLNNYTIDIYFWTITVTFSGAFSALISIIIHFHFNEKSLKTIRKEAPGLAIIVSTKDGLEKFLKFLVSEFSVENLEFFTLSMRWRHRLVLRDQRREIRKQKKVSPSTDTPVPVEHEKENDDNDDGDPNTPTYTFVAPKQIEIVPSGSDNDIEAPVLAKGLGSLANVMESISSPFSASAQRPVPSNMTLMHLQRDMPGDANTLLKQLPFPLLTFEFLDRDVAKKKRHHNTITETSYCPEFSKTKTVMLHRELPPPTVPQTIPQASTTTQSFMTKTMVSVYFDQYDAMDRNRFRSKSSVKQNSLKTLTKTSSGRTTPLFESLTTNTKSTKTKTRTQTRTQTRSNRLKPTPTHEPIDSDDNEEVDDLVLDEPKMSEAPSYIEQISYEINMNFNANKRLSAKITPFVSAVKNRLDSDEPTEFMLAATDDGELKEEDEIGYKDDDDGQEHRYVVGNKNTLSVHDVYDDDVIKRWDTESERMGGLVPVVEEIPINFSLKHSQKQRNDVTFGGYFGDNTFDVYDDEWTDEFLSQKKMDYDRFITLSEDINVSFEARNRLRAFFKMYHTVSLFKKVDIGEYDVIFEMSWKDVWQNLNDSLRRFHHSKFYKEWLQSDATDNLNAIPVVKK